MKDKYVKNPVYIKHSLEQFHRIFSQPSLLFLNKLNIIALISELVVSFKKTRPMLWKSIISILLLVISISFSTSLILLLAKPAMKNNSLHSQYLFSDMPIENPLYNSCKNLIRYKILKVSNIAFNPFQNISENYWNFIVLEMQKYKKIKFPNAVLFSVNEKINPIMIKKKCILIALTLGITPGMDNIPEQAFYDISKINVLSILDNYLSLSKSEKI